MLQYNKDMFTIAKAEYDDLDRIAEIFSGARKRMKEAGNPDQWKDDRPSMDLVKKDIDEGNFYVVRDGEKIVGVFAFVIGIDPTYLEIEGSWIDDAPYGTIHRIASDGSAKGVFRAVLDYVEQFGVDIRIDTHKDNKAMLHVIVQNGFQRCGIIIVDDGSERIAFQKKI